MGSYPFPAGWQHSYLVLFLDLSCFLTNPSLPTTRRHWNNNNTFAADSTPIWNIFLHSHTVAQTQTNRKPISTSPFQQKSTMYCTVHMWSTVQPLSRLPRLRHTSQLVGRSIHFFDNVSLRLTISLHIYDTVMANGLLTPYSTVATCSVGIHARDTGVSSRGVKKKKARKGNEEQNANREIRKIMMNELSTA